MNIYYTGVGSKKNGKHSVKEFLDIMNKNFNINCSEFLQKLDYKPCKEYKEMNRKTMAYNIKHNKPLFNKNTTKFKPNNTKKYKKLLHIFSFKTPILYGIPHINNFTPFLI